MDSQIKKQKINDKNDVTIINTTNNARYNDDEDPLDTTDNMLNFSNLINADEEQSNTIVVKENLLNDSLENLAHECIEVLIVDNDSSVVKVHEKLFGRFQLKARHVSNGSDLNEVLQELIDCK